MTHNRIYPVPLLLAFVLLLALTPAAFAQKRKKRDTEYVPRDMVEVRQGNKWLVAEVVDSTRGGLIRVRLADSNRELTPATGIAARCRVRLWTQIDAAAYQRRGFFQLLSPLPVDLFSAWFCPDTELDI